jgi:hypothetical protein
MTLRSRAWMVAPFILAFSLAVRPPAAFAQVDPAAGPPPAAEARPARPSFEARLGRYLEEGFGPASILESAAMGALDHTTHTPRSWKLGADGYVRRFASEAATTAIQESIEFGLNEALRQDADYPRCQCAGGWRRARHALAWTVLARSADGRTTFAVGHVAGVFAANVLQTTWQPGRRAIAGVEMGSALMALDAAINLTREFWPDLKRRFR